MPPTVIRLVAIASLSALTAVASPAAVAATPPADDPVADLAAVCQRLLSGFSYWGTEPARKIEAQLAAGGGDGEEGVGLRGLLAIEHLKLGQPEQAIAAFERALDEARRLRLDGAKIKVFLWNLALAHLQAAEDLNCVLDHAASVCIVPFDDGGRHRLPEHGRAAAEVLTEFLRLDPRSIRAAWLLNLARMVTGDFPDGVPPRYRLEAAAFAPESAFAAWRNVAPALGVDVVDLAGGAVLEDFDGDGWLDIVTSTSDPCDHLKAFRNDGRGGFEEVTAAWGLAGQLGGLNLIQGDADGDGRLDLYVLRGAWLEDEGKIRNSLLRNALHEGGTFVDVTAAAGLLEPAMPTLAGAFADYDLDGDLDLYVASELGDGQTPLPSLLYRNEGVDASGQVSFTEVGEAAGVRNLRQAKGVAWGDFDDDGDPDLFVSNQGGNRLYRNLGPGADGGEVRFEDVTAQLGVDDGGRFSFACWFFDHDNDGDLDLFVANYQASASQVAAAYFGMQIADGQPLLYRNDGGRFTEVSRAIGFTRPLLPMGANFGDLDNDGWLDLYLGTGNPDFATLVPNVMMRNRGDGGFAEVTMAGRFGHLQKGHGVAFGDLDGDGDQDLLHQLGGFYPGDAFANALFENPGGGGHWITLRFTGRGAGRGANRFAIGARVTARGRDGGRVRSIHQVVGSGGSFGASSVQLELGVGGMTTVDSLEVRWPGGAVERFAEVAVDRVYRVVEGREVLEAVAQTPIVLGAGGGTAAGHQHR